MANSPKINSPTGSEPSRLTQDQMKCSSIASRLLVSVLAQNFEAAGHTDLPECLRTHDAPTTVGAFGSEGTTAAVVASDKGQRPQSPGEMEGNLFAIMSHLNRQVRREYSSLFNTMMEELRPTARTAYPQFCGVTEELFRSGVTYGKIISLYVFCGELAIYCLDRPGMGREFVASVLGWFKRFFDSRLATWMVDRHGWVSALTV